MGTREAVIDFILSERFSGGGLTWQKLVTVVRSFGISLTAAEVEVFRDSASRLGGYIPNDAARRVLMSLSTDCNLVESMIRGVDCVAGMGRSGFDVDALLHSLQDARSGYIDHKELKAALLDWNTHWSLFHDGRVCGAEEIKRLLKDWFRVATYSIVVPALSSIGHKSCTHG